MICYHGLCDCCGASGDLVQVLAEYEIPGRIRMVCDACRRAADDEIHRIRADHQQSLNATLRLRVKVLLLKRAGVIAEPPRRQSLFGRLFGGRSRAVTTRPREPQADGE